MDHHEAVSLLAGTSLIAPGSRLDEARQTVLADLERLRQVEQRALDVRDGSSSQPLGVIIASTARWILGETR